MKIKTKEVQLRERIDELNRAITYTSDELKIARNKRATKEGWGILSFVLSSYSTLSYDIRHRESQLNLLIEYRNMLLEQL